MGLLESPAQKRSQKGLKSPKSLTLNKFPKDLKYFYISDFQMRFDKTLTTCGLKSQRGTHSAVLSILLRRWFAPRARAYIAA